MNRYAPELALVAGGLLGTVFGGFVLFSVGEFYSAAVVCALLSYPFAAYAIYNDDDPTTVLPPQAVTGLAGVGGIGIVLDVLRVRSPTVDSLLFGLLLALLVFLPVAAYAVQYGEPPTWLDPRAVEIGGTILAVGLLAGGLGGGAPTAGTASAVLVFLAATLFAARSTGIRRGRRELVPVGGLVVAGGLLTIGSATGGSLDPWMIAALGTAFGPLLSAALATTMAS